MEQKFYLTNRIEFIVSFFWVMIIYIFFSHFFYQCIFIRSEANSSEILKNSIAHWEATGYQCFLNISSIQKISFRIQMGRTCRAQLQANILLDFTFFWEVIWYYGFKVEFMPKKRYGVCDFCNLQISSIFWVSFTQCSLEDWNFKQPRT